MRELSFGANSFPLPSGPLMRSRGTDTMVTLFPTGSSDATIIVSVSVAGRHGRASMPSSRTFSHSSTPGRDGPLGAPWAPSVPPSKTWSKVSPNAVP